jgi:predicted metalloprotease with PDZ domain
MNSTTALRNMRRYSYYLTLLILVSAVPSILSAQRGAGSGSSGAAPITYHVTFPEPEHHWMQVEMTVSNLRTQPLDARMSRSSPGRYAVAEFAKNVFWLEAYNGKGQKLSYTRPDADVWRIAGHDGTVRVVYRIFGDYANGTYFGVDTTHAHLQMPAAFMWAVGHDNQPIRITFTAAASSRWKIGTQLYTTNDPDTFTAPNLQYFMDSPTELSDFLTSTFTVPNTDGTPANFRLVVHSDGSQSDVDELAKMVQRLVREQMAVFGELPKYEPGNYTFLLDYVPWGAGDGMEHRNSTSISSTRISLKTPDGKKSALGTISHEFFHNWNMERIRSAGLEPFDFTRENVTCCLWLGEGFTQYYGPLLLTRAGLDTGQRGSGPPVGNAVSVINAPGRADRSPVQMSEYAPFADGAGTFVDQTDSDRTFLSYYTYGAGIALALDLSLREMSDGKQSLDDFMRLLWAEHGKPGGPAPGLVAKPYTLKDLRDHLAALTGNRKFADDFFEKYIEGREVPDYARLLEPAGYVLKMTDSGRGWIGKVVVAESADGLVIGAEDGGGYRSGPSVVPFDTPLYDAGVDSGDTITVIDGHRATLDAWNAIPNRNPGALVAITVMRRDGTIVTKSITLKPDPTAQQIVPVESLPGGNLTPAQKAFREAWLSTKAK